MFPLNVNPHKMRKRNHEKYKVSKSLTERHKSSALPYMQRLLNESERMKRKILKQIQGDRFDCASGTWVLQSLFWD